MALPLHPATGFELAAVTALSPGQSGYETAHGVRPRVALNMIVKNEAHVIERCLRSVLPFIDYWVIVDTGSTDGTRSAIRRLLKDMPGELHERPWKDFGHNRSEALLLARQKADYLFVIDADEVLILPPDFHRPALTADAYSLTVEYGDIHYGRVCLISNRLNWRYVGVLHEYLAVDAGYRQESLPGAMVRVFSDGARSRAGATVDKYLNDARTLEAALEQEPNNPRYVFYLAQSYRDALQWEKAVEHYRRRTQMGGWEEEVWYALYQIAVLSERLQRDPSTVIGQYLQAFQARPRRAESLGQLARYCRERGDHALAHLVSAKAITIERPDDLLFIEESMYRWRCLDEYAIACYWTGQYAESAQACRRLLASDVLPVSERVRIGANLSFAEAALVTR